MPESNLDPLEPAEAQQEGAFDTFLNNAETRQRERLSASGHLASKLPPAQAAEALQLSVRSGLPLDTVFRDLPGTKAAVDKVQPGQLEELRKIAPNTADWATDPYRMAAGKDDLARMAEVEKAIGELAKPTFRASTDQELEAIHGPAARRQAAEDFPKQAAAMEPHPLSGVAQIPWAAALPKESLADMEKRYVSSAIAVARRKEAFLQGDTSRTSFLERASEALGMGADAGIGTNVLGRLGMQRVFGDDSPALRAAIADTQKRMEQTPKGTDFASRWLYPTSKLVAQMVDTADKALERGAQGSIFGAGLGVAGGPAAPVTVPAGFFGGFGVGMMFGMAEQSFVTEGGNAYIELDQIRGKNGEQLDEGVKRGAAVTVGILNAALEVVGVKLITAPFKAAAKKAFMDGIKEVAVKPSMARILLGLGKEYVASTVGESTTEVMQEGVNVVAEELSKMASKGEFEKATAADITERLVSIFSETMRGTMLLGGVGPGTHAATEVHQIRQAKHTQETLDKIGKLHDQIKLAATNPEETEHIAKAVVDRIGLPYVTVAAAPIAEFYQKAGIDPAQRIAELTGTSEGFAETVQAKGDIQIPTEKYLAMSPEEKTFMQSEIRRDPMDMTVSETEKLMEEARSQAETKAAESLSDQVILPIAKRVAKREANAQLAEMKRSDIISRVEHDFGGKLYWLNEAGQQAEELTTSGIPQKMIADMRRVDKEGRTYAAPIDEVAAKYDLSPEELLAEIKRADAAREKASSAILSEEIPPHIIDAVTDQEFQKAIRSNLTEAEQNRKLEEAVAARAKHKRVVASVQKVADEIKAALESAGFKKEAAAVAKYVSVTFQTLGQRENVDPYKLFSERSMTIERRGEIPVTAEGQVFEQPRRKKVSYGYEENLGNVAKEQFGVTNDLNEAGYVLPDGTYLDFSGRHQAVGYEKSGDRYVALPGQAGDYRAGHRVIDHRELGAKIRDAVGVGGKDPTHGEIYEGTATDVMLKFQKAAGAVRYMSGLGISANFMPTVEQIAKILKDYKREFPGDPINVDVINESSSGSMHDSVEVKNPTVEKVMAVFERAFGHEQPGEAGKPRGRIRLGDVAVNIDLFKEADSSTFLHETGHLYLDLLERLATREGASDQIRADWKTVLDWLGRKEGEKISKDNHEQWARSFEKYLLEGNAPSKRLRGVFYRFKEWLTDIYQGAKEALGVELNADIRKVMDRLLATDEEILQAQFDQAQAPLFEDAKAAGATDEQAQRYAELTLKAKQIAEEKLLQKGMEQARREQMEWYKDAKAKARAEVEEDVNKEPIYRAVSVLQKNETPAGVKLLTPALKIDRDSLPAEIKPSMLPRAITSAEGGTHLDIVAGMFGFEDGRAFLNALQGMEERNAKIDRLTDERMLAEYGGEPTEADFKEYARAAIHNDARAEQMLLEMQILARGDPKMLRLVAGGIPRLDVVRKEAERAVGRQAIRTINPKVYAASERRANKAALEAHIKGDDAEALVQRRNSLAFHAGFIAADDAKEDVGSSLERWKFLQKSDEKLAKTRDMDYVNVARAILASINIGKTDKSASDYLAFMKQYDPQLYADMKDLVDQAVPEANRELADLTYDEFRAVKRAVDAVLEMSTKTNQIKVGLVREHIKDVIAKLTVEMDAIEKAKPSDSTRTKTDENVGLLIQGRAGFTRVEHWAEAIGDFFRQVFPEKIHEGTDAYREFLDEYLKKYEAIVKELPKLSTEAIYSHELGFTFENGKRDLLGALLHTGNREDGGSNLWKLLLGRKWAKLDEEGNLDTSRWDRFIGRMQEKGILTKADYDYVQRVWDLFEEIKPQLQQTHKALNGYHFSEITATPFSTPWGEYRGGYFPAIADPSEVEAAAIRGEQAEAEVGNSFSLPTAGIGRTKHRSAGYWKALRMDVRQVEEHIRWAGKYINIEPHVAELRRLMWNTEFRDRLKAFNPSAAGGIIMPWLQRSVTQTVEKPMSKPWAIVGKIARWMKTTAGVKQLGLNIINAAQNYEGLVVATTKVSGGNIVQALGGYLASPLETHRAINELSTYMKHRTQEIVGQLQDTTDEILHDAGLWKNAKRLTMKHVFALSKLTQGMVDDVVWKAAFNEAIANGKDETSAVKHADSIVRTTQGSSAPEDISNFEAGNAGVRLFTMYTSWFNMRANLLGSEGLKIIRKEMGLPAKAARLSVLAMTGFTVPALVSGMIYKLLSNQDLDPDDDGYLDDIMAFFFGSQFKEAKAMAPGVGPLIDVMVNKFDKNPHNDNINVSPAVSLMEQFASTPFDIYEATLGKDKYGRPIKGAKGKAVDDVLTVFGGLTGIPTGALAKPAKYITNVAEESKRPSGPVDFLRGVLTGSGSVPKKKGVR